MVMNKFLVKFFITRRLRDYVFNSICFYILCAAIGFMVYASGGEIEGTIDIATALFAYIILVVLFIGYIYGLITQKKLSKQG